MAMMQNITSAFSDAHKSFLQFRQNLIYFSQLVNISRCYVH